MARYHRMTKIYAPTLKDEPTEAELPSHRLLLRAGMIRRTAQGLYSYLPLAWRSIQKIKAIIREEMDAIDAQEMQVPIATPAELWEESGRWDVYGPELMRLHDRHEHQFALGPTHEETFTDVVRNELRSYRQLPVVLYQIQDKFRDERRPRFGLMRSREFIMKDAYSFAANEESSRQCYEDQKAAYQKIFDRLAIRTLPVVADTGQIGGDASVEFMALADAGEAELVWCDCGWAADTEAATCAIRTEDSPAGEMKRIDTPHVQSIAQLADFLSVDSCATRKAFALIDGDNTAWLCFVPGDHEINDVKAEHAFGNYHMMTEEELEACGLIAGYMGPVNLPNNVRIAADISLENSQYWLVGANEEHAHLSSVKPGRDFTIDRWVDVAHAREGDLCPECGKLVHAARGIEVGQVFLFDDKYSTPMHATFMDEAGSERPFLMGSYGIGVSRTLAAVVEQCHDEHGICFPLPVAPFELSVIPLSASDADVVSAADTIATELAQAGVDVVLDDRNERPGVKFADNDLWGFPFQIICGKRSVSAGMCELKIRATGERRELKLSSVVQEVITLIHELQRTP